MLSETLLNSLYRYGLALTNDASLSFDLLHDALESYLRKSLGNRTEEEVRRYLRTSIRNRFIDHLRHEKRFPHDGLDAGNEKLVSLNLPDPSELLVDRDTLERILDRLSPAERELLYLWAYEERTAQEISNLLDAPRGTVLSRIHRLRKKIARFDLETSVQPGEGLS